MSATFDRRRLLRWGMGGSFALGAALLTQRRREPSGPAGSSSAVSPAFSVIPVVGDGYWIWNKPPEGPTGYLQPRSYSLDVGIELVGRGDADQVAATTSVPVDCPEQKIESQEIQTEGCLAEVRQVGPYARQLVLRAPHIAPGQRITAVAHYKLTICKEFQGYQRDQFPETQTIPGDVRRQYLGDSPGIQTNAAVVHRLANELGAGLKHPWDLAQKFAAWIPRNIHPQLGKYTSVLAALENRLGDCEEMSAVFIALCRAMGIPARVVWVPNHNWAEIYLSDRAGVGHWLPVHTACYFWFGWTGAHELVLQKGDRLRVPESGRFFRLLEDWAQWMGRRPEVRYRAELTPLPPAPGADPGPGARSKVASGEWKLLGTHPLDRYMRR
jgi:hypothetical protein